jgi:hypothetical protein
MANAQNKNQSCYESGNDTCIFRDFGVSKVAVPLTTRPAYGRGRRKLLPLAAFSVLQKPNKLLATGGDMPIPPASEGALVRLY